MTARAVTICKSPLVPRSRGEWDQSSYAGGWSLRLAKMPLSFAICTGSPLPSPPLSPSRPISPPDVQLFKCRGRGCRTAEMSKRGPHWEWAVRVCMACLEDQATLWEVQWLFRLAAEEEGPLREGD